MKAGGGPRMLGAMQLRYTALTLCLALGCSDPHEQSDPTTSDVGAPADAAGEPPADADPGAQELPGDPPDGAAEPADVEASEDTSGGAVAPALDLAQWVDPRIGTANSGNVAVGAAVPHGWVRLGPDTVGEGLDIAAYRYGATTIEGFTHTQLSGAGGSGYGYSHLLVMPTRGALPANAAAWRSDFDHANETVEAGYYAVALANGVRAELTATGLAGLHRYTYPATDAAHVVFDVGHSLGKSTGGHVEVVGDRTISGWGDYQVHPTISFLLGDENTGALRVYFVAHFSRPFTEVNLFTRGKEPAVASTLDGAESVAVASFGALAASDTVELSVGLSLIDGATAQRNLDAQVGDQGFDDVRAAARAAWNARLNRVQVKGTKDDKRIFYTALYHLMLQPADLTEAGPSGAQFSSALDGKRHTHDAGARRYYTDDWCGWDTFRTAHPLRTLIEPEVVGDLIESQIHAYREGGWLDVCPWAAGGYSRVMIGNTTFPMVADALRKGLDDFDPVDGWAALVQSADHYLANPLEEGACGYLELGTPEAYETLGWVPDECDSTQAASMTMEYAYEDWCLAEVADRLGHDGTRYRARSQNWKNHWNADKGFMQSRRADGSWREPFDPADGSSKSGFVESNAWTYTFHVPHDVPGLAAIMGGDAALRAKLDAFFDGGFFDMGNEPGFHIPWMYALAGDPGATARRVKQLLDAHFHTGPGGLPGNDDSGATSAWAAFAQLGFYPVTVGDGRYVLGSPRFDHATLYPGGAAPNGKRFDIRVERSQPDAVVVSSASLNGEPLADPWLTHEQLMAGGELVLVLDAP